ncbi:hypothetical protein ACUTSW_10210 [Serratia sp. TSA_198.1]|uniref:hypothetical protein n=1 Tax=Serratia sp. TSA_198.1 TaxID=3415664 RepID=UPI004045629E
MSKSNLVAFRVPADLQNAFNQTVAASGGDKSAWLVDAGYQTKGSKAWDKDIYNA